MYNFTVWNFILTCKNVYLVFTKFQHPTTCFKLVIQATYIYLPSLAPMNKILEQLIATYDEVCGLCIITNLLSFKLYAAQNVQKFQTISENFQLIFKSIKKRVNIVEQRNHGNAFVYKNK